jgi:hypothetical protein
VNVVDLAPAATVTVAGTVNAEVRELARLTTSPPAGAALSNVMVPVLVAPLFTRVAEKVRAMVVGEGTGVTVKVVVLVLAPIAAVRVTDLLAVTGVVFTLKVAVVLPELTVTEEVTVAETSEELRFTTVPAAGANFDRVTVPVTAVADPPITVEGATARLETIGGVTPDSEKALKSIAPQPVTKSHPTLALAVWLFGIVPEAVPEVTSKKMVGLPLKE